MMERGRTHQSETNLHHRTEIRPVVLERHCVDD